MHVESVTKGTCSIEFGEQAEIRDDTKEFESEVIDE